MLYALKMHKSSQQSLGPNEQASSALPERRIVLKFGSRLLTGDRAELDPERMASVARAVAAEPKTEAVIVSSGAIAAGFKTLGHASPPKRIQDRQAAAAVGQGRLMSLWDDAFRAVGLLSLIHI